MAQIRDAIDADVYRASEALPSLRVMAAGDRTEDRTGQPSKRAERLLRLLR